MEKILKSYVSDKCVFSGSYVELYKYSIPIRCDYSRRSYTKLRVSDDDYVRRDDSLARSRQNVRRIVWSNLTPHTKFLTLTCADNVTDVKVFRRMFTTFLQAMNRCGYDLKYLYVLERQKRGAIHAHLIVFNDEIIPLKVLKSCWHYGRSNVHILNGLKYNSDERVRDVGSYICKYITKEAVTEWGTRTYNCSKGLKRPVDVSLKVYGDSDFGYMSNPRDYSRIIVEQLLSHTQWNYTGNKSVILDRSTNCPLIQNIDYYQGRLKGDVHIELER